MKDKITIQFYKCIVCGKTVGCKPNTPKEKRYCNTHKEEEIKETLIKLKKPVMGCGIHLEGWTPSFICGNIDKFTGKLILCSKCKE